MDLRLGQNTVWLWRTYLPVLVGRYVWLCLREVFINSRAAGRVKIWSKGGWTLSFSENWCSRIFYVPYLFKINCILFIFSFIFSLLPLSCLFFFLFTFSLLFHHLLLSTYTDLCFQIIKIVNCCPFFSLFLVGTPSQFTHSSVLCIHRNMVSEISLQFFQFLVFYSGMQKSVVELLFFNSDTWKITVTVNALGIIPT